MPRPLRITVPNLPFHVLDRGNNRQIVFHKEEDFIYFLELLRRYKKELKFKLYHFCLMPNHLHLLLEPTIEGSLPKMMMRLTLAYSWYFNKKYRGVGHVWQGRYKSSLIDNENYFIWCGLYVELNPVRARLVSKPEDWRWSSYRFYTYGEIDPLTERLIDVDPYYLELGSNNRERQKNYQKDVEEVMKEEFLRSIRGKLDEGVLGKEEFVRKAKEEFKIKSLRSRGRPRKENRVDPI
jgi:putative transposase